MATLTSLRDIAWMIVGTLIVALVAEMIFERILHGSPPVPHGAQATAEPPVLLGSALALPMRATKHHDGCRRSINNRFVAPPG